MKRYVLVILILLVGSSSYAKPESGTDDVSGVAVTTLLRDAGLSQNARGRAPHLEFLNLDARGFETLRLTWNHPVLGSVRVALRGEKNFLRGTRAKRLIVIAAGFNTRGRTVEMMGDHPETVVAAFEYPENEDTLAQDPTRAGRFLRFSSGQLAFVLQELSQASWVRETAVMGVSLGGLILPSALRMAQQIGARVERVVFAYSGASLGPILRKWFPSDWPEFLKEPLVNTILNLTSLLDPKMHLPHLRGQFLVIRATREEVFPAESYLKLEELVPRPKVLGLVYGPHITEEQPKMILDTQKLIQEWWDQK